MPEDASFPALRTPPQNVEAEQALLGAILLNDGTLSRVEDFLKPEHFYNAVHQRIFAAMTKLALEGRNYDAVALKNYFEHDGTLAPVGGHNYLARLAAEAVTIINAGDYGTIIFEAHLRRQLIEVGTEMVNDGHDYDLDRPANDMIDEAERRLYELATTGTADAGFKTFSEALGSALKEAERAFTHAGGTSGVGTGFRDLDKKLGGLQASDLLILAGRPSMGKTALATNIAFNVAKKYRPGSDQTGQRITAEGGVVGFFSLEMSAEQLVTRILAEESGISGDHIRRGEVTQDGFTKFVETAQLLGKTPLFIDATPALSIAAIRSRARRLKRQHGLDVLVVDYLQLIQGTGRPGAEQNRVQELSEITRGLKAMAKELDIPVIALSQLSRAVENREDKRPQLADLRESGSIEQDADVVMFVYRDEYYLERAVPSRRPEESEEKFNERYAAWQARYAEAHNKAELIIAKQRHGPTGIIHLTFNGEITKFSDHVDSDRLPDHY